MWEVLKSIELIYLQWIPPGVVAIFLLFFLYRFVVDYRLPARRIQHELLDLRSQVRGLKAESPARIVAAMDNVFASAHERIQHAWSEYKETLHEQLTTADGEHRIEKVRSTTQSSTFFGDQNLVETPLKTEYFKHLPGILTGIGIIGTFAGLLIGLFSFDAGNPEKISKSVEVLLHGVRDAFIASACAIGIAMYVTNSEKKYLRQCYEALEGLTESIDSLFDAGVGEEYLASLVKSSEESARQARQLKDGLVSDLREMLQNLVDSQVRENMKLAETLGSVYRQSGNDIASSISGSIEQSFREPLQQIAQSVQAASSDQSGQVQGLLQDVLTAFMNKLDASFGQQFNGMQEMLGQSLLSMQQMQSSFQTLVNEMRVASETSGQAMSAQLNRAIADMTAGQSVMQAAMNEMIANLQQAVTNIGSKGEEAGSRMGEQLERLFAESEVRQQRMAEGMQAFVEGLKESVGRGQQETMAEISATVGRLGEQLGGVMQMLEASRQGMSDGAIQAQQRVQDGAQALVSDLGENVQALLAGLQGQKQESELALARLSDATQRSIDGMRDGADRMRQAADRFGAAGESALKLMDASGNAVQQFNAGGATVSTATRELAAQVAAYQQHRDAVQKMLATLEGIVAGSQNETIARTRMVSELAQVSDQMKQVNTEAAAYLERIGGVLDTSFSRFGDGVEQGLTRTLGTLDQELSKAVGALATGVQEVGDSVEELSEALGKLRR